MKKLLAVAALALVLTSTAQAQSANISATATVAQALNVSAGTALAFGNVFNGFTRTILPTDAASGSFSLTGAAGAQVALTFTLPANLVYLTNNLPVTFGATSASWSTAGTRTGSTVINPGVANSVNLDAALGTLSVYIGGAVSPVGMAAGSYTGTITLAAAYTGN